MNGVDWATGICLESFCVVSFSPTGDCNNDIYKTKPLLYYKKNVPEEVPELLLCQEVWQLL